MFVEALLGQQGLALQGMITSAFNEMSQQTEADALWDEGRQLDMAAFDQLPRMVRDYINEHGCAVNLEDLLWEHINDHNRDPELTIVYIMEFEEDLRDLGML